MPNLEEVLEKFGTWRANAARVQVAWELATGAVNQKLLTAQVEGIVKVIEPVGERTLVIVGRDNNIIRMYLTEGCTFQTVTFGSGDPANIADVESMTRIGFPTGEQCFVTFYHPPN